MLCDASNRLCDETSVIGDLGNTVLHAPELISLIFDFLLSQISLEVQRRADSAAPPRSLQGLERRRGCRALSCRVPHRCRGELWYLAG